MEDSLADVTFHNNSGEQIKSQNNVDSQSNANTGLLKTQSDIIVNSNNINKSKIELIKSMIFLVLAWCQDHQDSRTLLRSTVSPRVQSELILETLAKFWQTSFICLLALFSSIWSLRQFCLFTIKFLPTLTWDLSITFTKSAQLLKFCWEFKTN